MRRSLGHKNWMGKVFLEHAWNVPAGNSRRCRYFRSCTEFTNLPNGCTIFPAAHPSQGNGKSGVLAKVFKFARATLSVRPIFFSSILLGSPAAPITEHRPSIWSRQCSRTCRPFPKEILPRRSGTGLSRNRPDRYRLFDCMDQTRLYNRLCTSILLSFFFIFFFLYVNITD